MQTPRSILVATAVAAACASARAEFFPKEALMKGERKEVAGGHGTLHAEYAFTRDKALKEQAIKEVSWLQLNPGDSVGYHKHVNNEDVYVVVSGQGVFKDNDGRDHPIKPGDIMIARKGESHGIANSGSEPLVFVDVIAEQ